MLSSHREFIFLKTPTDGIIYELFEIYTPLGDEISGKNFLAVWDPFSVVSVVFASRDEIYRKRQVDTLYSSGKGLKENLEPSIRFIHLN